MNHAMLTMRPRPYRTAAVPPPVPQWAISTAVFSQSFSVASQGIAPQGVAFSSDGTKMFIVDSVEDAVSEYGLSTPWSVSTAVYSQQFSVASQDVVPFDITFSSDGTKMFIIGADNDAVYEYVLSSAWDISTAAYVQSASVLSQTSIAGGLAFSHDGARMYLCGGSQVFQYALSSSWDISTLAFVQQLGISAQESVAVAIGFRNDGAKMFVLGQSGDDINEYALSTPWDISTATFTTNFSVAVKDTTPSGMAFKPDGSRVYVCGASSASVHEYAISTGAVAITSQPGNQVAAGGEATFSVTASASAGVSLSYQWQKSTDSGATWSNVPGATGATLSLSGLTVSDSGTQYRVIVSATGFSSQTSQAASLTVYPDEFLTVGGNVSLSGSGTQADPLDGGVGSTFPISAGGALVVSVAVTGQMKGTWSNLQAASFASLTATRSGQPSGVIVGTTVTNSDRSGNPFSISVVAGETVSFTHDAASTLTISELSLWVEPPSP